VKHHPVLNLRHQTSRYLNNRLEQDHWGIKGRYRPMRGFKCPRWPSCKPHDPGLASSQLRRYFLARALTEPVEMHGQFCIDPALDVALEQEHQASG